MGNENKRICRPDCPQDGPKDGVMMNTDCIRTDFFENPAEGEALFQQSDKGEAHISASMEIGIFSIRDMRTGVMLSVSIVDAMELMAEAASAAKDAGTDEAPEGDKSVESVSDS